MTVELLPFGTTCNLQCQYCYQNLERDAGNVVKEYDMEVMKDALAEAGSAFSLFGGEPLLMPLNDLEELFRWGHEQFGANYIQTNGTLVNDDHIRLFVKYNVSVGLSIDGPGSLNDSRWAGKLSKTREQTRHIHDNLLKLLGASIDLGIIVTLNRNNASKVALPFLIEWIKCLDILKIESLRLHLLEVETQEIRDKYSLSEDENIHALMALMDLQDELQFISFDLFTEPYEFLKGYSDVACCVWRACDPYTTEAVQGVDGSGQMTNCTRASKEGVNWTKAETRGYERYLALYHTPQDYGGCAGCRFFLICKGQCPGTAIDGDWRNRTEHCGVYKRVFEVLESRLLGVGAVPLSLRNDREAIEKRQLIFWQEGNTGKSMREIVGDVERTEVGP